MGRLKKLFHFSGPNSRVKMIHSVDQYVAGEQYDIPTDIADRFIARGYSEGNLSRDFADHELHALRGNPQVVTFSG